MVLNIATYIYGYTKYSCHSKLQIFIMTQLLFSTLSKQICTLHKIVIILRDDFNIK